MSDNLEIALIEATSPDDLYLYDTCKLVADALHRAYPNHLWAVSWQGGAVVVKNMSISGHYGMLLENPRKFMAHQMELDAIKKGGELLERAGMKRGKWDGQGAQVLEGSDSQHFKPWAS